MKKSDSFFTEGCTDKGNIIYFVQFPENKLVFKQCDSNLDLNLEDKNLPIIIYSNFIFTNNIIADLERYKILRVASLCNRDTQLITYPCVGFDFEKLKIIIGDIVSKYDL